MGTWPQLRQLERHRTHKGQQKAKAQEWGEADLQNRTLPPYPCFALLFMLSFFSFLFSSSPNMTEPFSRKPLCGLFCKLQTKAFLSCKVLQRQANELSSSRQRQLLFWLPVQPAQRSPFWGVPPCCMAAQSFSPQRMSTLGAEYKQCVIPIYSGYAQLLY